MVKNGKEKGQIFSVDLIVAGTIFLMILTLIIVFANESSNRLEFLEKDNFRTEAAMHAANSVIYTEGNPGNWENQSDLNNVFGIGIAKSRNEIDSAKLQRFLDLNATRYSDVKDILGLAKYDVEITVINLQNNQKLAKFGLDSGDSNNITAVNRFAFYNGKNVVVRMKVFEE